MKMSYIEGIGDELLIVIAVLLLLVIVCLVWLSTSVIEPRISVVVIDAQRFHGLLNRVRNAGFRIININRTLNNSEGNTIPEVESRNNSEERGSDAPHDNIEEERSVDNVNISSLGNDSKNDVLIDNELQEQRQNVNDTDNPTPSASNTQNDNVKQEEATDSSIPSSSSASSNSSTIISTTYNCDSNVEKTCDNEESDVCIRSRQSLPEAQTQGGSSSQNAAEQTETITTDDSPLDGHIRIRLKYLDDRQKLVQAMPQQTVGEFKRSHFAGELAENLMVRLIYNGQELRPDTKPLQAYNIQDSGVIHCLLSQNTREETNSVHNEEEDYNIGTYIFPLFGIILGLIWYSRFSYGRYFNAISTLSLVGITFMYVIALLATFRSRDGEVHEHED